MLSSLESSPSLLTDPSTVGREPIPALFHRINLMATYEIQILTPYGWRADSDYLGGDDDDNKWPTKAAAQAAIDQLVALGSFDPETLRVALV